VKTLGVGTFLALAFVVGVPNVFAQPQGCCMGMPGYQVSTETTITGTVEDVVQPARGRMMGTHLLVKTEAGTIEVHLGPSAFLSREGFSFAKGDTVEVVGSKMTMGGGEVIIARELSKDGKKLTLRDKTGRPVWAGPMKRG